LAALATLDLPSFKYLQSSFSAPLLLSMQKFALRNAGRVATLTAAGKVVSPFFFTNFFPLPSYLTLTLFDFRMLPASHQLLRVRMLLQSLVRHTAVLRIHPADLPH
jgi:hypothetical protein